MSALLLVAAGVALLAGAGAGLVGLLPVPEEDGTDPLHAGWCFLAGSALAGLLLHVPLAIDGRISHAAFFLVFGLCLVLAAGPGRLHVRRVGVGRFLGLDLLRALPLWLRALAVALALLAASAGLESLSGWDERATFGLKARVLYHAGTIRGEAFTDADLVNFQTRYPLHIPLLEAALFVLQGSFEDLHLKLLFALFGLSLVLVVAGEARRRDGPRVGALWGLLLMTTPFLISPVDGRGMTAYADLPLAAYVTGAAVLLGRALERPDPRGTLLAGLLLGAALATKHEGVLWAFALGFALLLTLWRRAPAHRAPLASGAAEVALPALLFLGLSVAARRWIPPSFWSEQYADAIRLDWLGRLGGRPLQIAPFVLRQLADGREWGWGWLLVLIGLLVLHRPRLSPAPFLWRSAALAIFAADLAVFIVTPYEVHWHLVTALPRLLLQLFPLALLILAEQVSASGWLPQGLSGSRKRAS
jgi:hypothetical protein